MVYLRVVVLVFRHELEHGCAREMFDTDRTVHQLLKEGEISIRVFLNLWFSKPMVCVRVAFHENDGNHENAKTTKTIQTATNKELSAGFAEITETTKMTKTTGIQGANHGFPRPRV